MRHPLPHPQRYGIAVRYITAEYLRNRTALFLLVVLVPLWYLLMVAIMPHDPVSFRFGPTGGFLSVDSQAISVLTAGLNAITLIVGFLIFSTTKRGISFDHRLVLCGYPRASSWPPGSPPWRWPHVRSPATQPSCCCSSSDRSRSSSSFLAWPRPASPREPSVFSSACSSVASSRASL